MQRWSRAPADENADITLLRAPFPIAGSPVLYRQRNRIERYFHRIKHFRRLATRYEKHAANFLAMLKLAAAQLSLRHNESVACCVAINHR